MISIKKIISILIIGVFIGASFIPSMMGLKNQIFLTNEKIFFLIDEENNEINLKIDFSQPRYISINDNINIDIAETNCYTKIPGESKLPYYSKTIFLPFGSKLNNIEVNYSIPESFDNFENIEKIPIPKKYPSSNQLIKEPSYHSKHFDYQTGGGLVDGEHVTILTLNIYPVKHHKGQNTLHFIKNFDLKISYEQPAMPFQLNDELFRLIILAPKKFKKPLETLVVHKQKYDMPAKLVTLDEIYQDTYFQVEGYDKAEEIKYFISEAFKNWGTEYVLLIGNKNNFPMRKTWMGTGNYQLNPLTDLYYSDLFFNDGSFCSWDSNNNGYYGEISHGSSDDQIDLYPDVYIGRLACNNIIEVNTVVDKIIKYEEESFEEEWLDNIILIGGDTHPSHNDFSEGEFLIEKIAEATPDLNHIMLRTSDGTYNADLFNDAIEEGAGFICYSGHGFENGLGTHPPLEETWISYRTNNLIELKNQHKLPIAFFSACLTARLDYNILNLFADIIYYLLQLPRLDKPEIYFPILFPCFAWAMVSKPNGGAIATIGATRVAYSMIDSTGVHGGCGFLALKFYEAQHQSEYLGEMFVSAKNEFIENAHWWDPFTVEEFILLGDPSLKIGGYSPEE